MELSDKVYRLNLGVPKEFEDMSAYAAYLGNGVVSLEKRIAELEQQLAEAKELCFECKNHKAENERLHKMIGETDRLARERMAEYRAENKRLRDALDKIEHQRPVMGSTDDYRQGQKDALEVVSAIAKQALNPT